jgi:glycerophosphoryl diester phosphodiesterase
LFHDDDLAGTTGLSGRVGEHTLEEILKADAGSKFATRFAGQRILTLEEGLRLAKGRMNLYLNGKRVDPLLLAREVLAADMGSQVVVHDSPEVLRAVRSVAGERIGLMAKWQPRLGLDTWIQEVRPHAVEIDAEDVTPEVCREFHRRGIKVEARVLGQNDRPEVWDRMARDGVDWAQSDVAEEVIARRILKAAGPDRVKIAHHRGASRYAPENTLEGLKKSVALGADFIEFDIQTTRDGAFVLMHDSTLNRTTTGKGRVREHTLAEISQLTAGAGFGGSFTGARIPTLEEFLAAAAPLGISLYVDAKDIAPEALVAALERHGVTDRAVVYQGANYLEKLKGIAPKLRRMPPLRDPSKLDEVVKRVQPYAFDTNWGILSKPLIDRCHALGVKVFSDALGRHETIADYQKAMAEGIDLIQTDQPLRVLRAIELNN